MNTEVFFKSPRRSGGKASCLALIASVLVSPALQLSAASGSNAPMRMNTAPRVTPQSRSTDYSAFKIISDRNIFNPRRYARSNPQDRRDTRRAVRVDALTLVGTMKYEKGPFAFFDGTSSSYRKVLQKGDEVAGFKLEKIDGKGVKLLWRTNEIDLNVGFQLRREDDGDWHVVSATEIASSNQSRPPSGPPPVTTITRTITVPVTNTPPEQPQPPIIILPGADGTDPTVLNDQQMAQPNQPPPQFDPNQAPAPPAAAADAAGGTPEEILRRLAERREQEINR